MNRWRHPPSALALLWLLSLFFSLPLVEPLALSRLASVGFMLVALILAGWLWLKDETRAPVLKPLPVLLILFFFWAALSLLWTESFYHSYIGIWRLFLLPGSFLIFFLAGSGRLYRSAAIGAAVITGALALWALAQYFFLTDLLVTGQARSVFANPNSYAAFLALGLLPGLGVMLATKRCLHANLLLLFCAITLAGTIILASRGVLLALAVALIFMLVANRRFLHQHWRCGLILLIVATSAFILPVITGQGGAASRFGNFAENPEAVANTRFIIWDATWQIIKEHKILGTGFETFALNYPAYRPIADKFSGGRMAHNDPLQFWAELGLPGFLLFYLIIALCGFYMIRFLRQTLPDQADRILPVSCFAALGLVLGHSHISFDLYIAAFLPVLGLVIAYWYSNTCPALTESGPANTVQKATYFSLALVACAGFFLLQGLLRSSWHSGEAERLAKTSDIQAFARHANIAHEAGFGLHAEPYLLAASLPLATLQERFYTLPAEERQQLAAQTKSHLTNALARNPLDPRAYYAYARLYLLQQKPEQAAQMLGSALKYDPLHLPSRMMLADIYKASGREDKAWALLKEGLDRPYPLHDTREYHRLVLAEALRREEIEIIIKIQDRI